MPHCGARSSGILVSQASPPYEKIVGQKPISHVSQRNVFGYVMITCDFLNVMPNFYYCVNNKLCVRSVGTKETSLKMSFSLANAFIIIDSFYFFFISTYHSLAVATVKADSTSMVAICKRTHLGVISIFGIIIVSCDRLLERDWCAPYGAWVTRAFDQTPSR